MEKMMNWQNYRLCDTIPRVRTASACVVFTSNMRCRISETCNWQVVVGSSCSTKLSRVNNTKRKGISDGRRLYSLYENVEAVALDERKLPMLVCFFTCLNDIFFNESHWADAHWSLRLQIQIYSFMLLLNCPAKRSPAENKSPCSGVCFFDCPSRHEPQVPTKKVQAADYASATPYLQRARNNKLNSSLFLFVQWVFSEPAC